MATYIIADRNHNIIATRSAKAAYEAATDLGGALFAPLTENVVVVEAPKAIAEQVCPAETVIEIVSGALFVNGEQVATVEGSRDKSGRADKHVPYSLAFSEDVKVGSFAYKKELVESIETQEVRDQIWNILNPAPVVEAVETAEQPADAVVTLKELRKRLYSELRIELFGAKSDEWTVQIVVHH